MYRSRAFRKALGRSGPNMALIFAALLATDLRTCSEPASVGGLFQLTAGGVLRRKLGAPVAGKPALRTFGTGPFRPLVAYLKTAVA
jgi:hypothetical protein